MFLCAVVGRMAIHRDAKIVAVNVLLAAVLSTEIASHYNAKIAVANVFPLAVVASGTAIHCDEEIVALNVLLLSSRMTSHCDSMIAIVKVIPLVLSSWMVLHSDAKIVTVNNHLLVHLVRTARAEAHPAGYIRPCLKMQGKKD